MFCGSILKLNRKNLIGKSQFWTCKLTEGSYANTTGIRVKAKPCRLSNVQKTLKLFTAYLVFNYSFLYLQFNFIYKNAINWQLTYHYSYFNLPY